MSSVKWKIIDKSYKPPYYFNCEDIKACRFAREYISGAGYDVSTDNNIIQNFKIPPSQTHRLKHKEKAIAQFAKDLSVMFEGNEYITFIPSSKCYADPEYDKRMDDTCSILQQNYYPNIKIIHPINQRSSLQSYHESKKKRIIEDIYNNFEWKGVPSDLESLFIIDDVLTTGAHFKAYQRLFAEYSPHVTLYGIFWAISIFPEPTAESFGFYDENCLP